METTMTCGFTSLTVDEMQSIDGGAWKWYDIALTVMFPGYGIGKIITEDLQRCYQNAYDEVMFSNSKRK